MEHAVDALRADGEGFSMQLMTLAGRAIEADGRAIGGRAVLRLRDVSGFKRELAELNARHEKLAERSRIAAHADRRAAVAGLGARHRRRADLRQPRLRPRGRGQGPGRRAGAVARTAQPRARDEASRARAAGKHLCRPRTPAIVAGARRIFDVLDVPTRKGSAGIGIDATEAEAMRSELKRLSDAHRRTLDQLATGVAIFTADQHLTFYNTAYRSLWDLDARLPRPEPDRFRGARPAARRAQAARGEGLPRMEGRAARGLSRDRGPRASLAPARRPHAARRHHAQSAGRRDLSVRGRHRAAASWCGATTR